MLKASNKQQSNNNSKKHYCGLFKISKHNIVIALLLYSSLLPLQLPLRQLSACRGNQTKFHISLSLSLSLSLFFRNFMFIL